MNEASQIATAQNKPAVVAGVGRQEFLTFTLGAEEYGIEILKVQEIRSYEQVTKIANAPEFIKGVVNLRGEVFRALKAEVGEEWGRGHDFH